MRCKKWSQSIRFFGGAHCPMKYDWGLLIFSRTSGISSCQHIPKGKGCYFENFTPKKEVYKSLQSQERQSKIAIYICRQEPFFHTSPPDFSEFLHMFLLKPPVTCTTSVRFHIGDVFEVWTQGVLDVAGEFSVYGPLLRLPRCLWVLLSFFVKRYTTPKMNESRPWKLTSIFKRKWIIDPNHHFSGDMLVFTGGSDSMDSSKSQHGYCLHQFLDSWTNLCAKVLIVKTTTSNRMQSDLLENLNIRKQKYISIFIMASLWLLCPTTQRTENSGTKKHPNLLNESDLGLGPLVGYVWELSHSSRTSWESWLPVLLEG